MERNEQVKEGEGKAIHQAAKLAAFLFSQGK